MIIYHFELNLTEMLRVTNDNRAIPSVDIDLQRLIAKAKNLLPHIVSWFISSRHRRSIFVEANRTRRDAVNDEIIYIPCNICYLDHPRETFYKIIL